MQTFTLELSTNIYFGNHIVPKALKAETAWLRGTIFLVTTGRSLIRAGYVQELKEMLDQLPEVDRVISFDNISANPKLSEVEAAVKQGREEGVSCIVGFGGGSALDAAKAVAVGIGTGEDLRPFMLDGKEPGAETLPILAIPTTAGTGSELSKGAILSIPELRLKTGIRGKNILPRAAIVDPVYTWTVPLKTTLETGFDVLAHAIESYVSVKANAFSVMLSEKAIRQAAENLPLLCQNLDNATAREAMSYASMLMGINLANVGTCLPHRIQYVIGAETDTSHGAGLAALYPSWIRHQYEVSPEKINDVLGWILGKQADCGQAAGELFADYIKKIKVVYKLEELGIRQDALPELALHVTGNLSNDLLSRQEHAISRILAESF